MKTVVILMAMSILATSKIIDFDKNGNIAKWNVVNDGVMGGLSSSRVKQYNDYVEFKGEVSLDNNGGFASYCSPYSEYNFSEYTTVHIKYALKGQPCALTFENDYRYYYPNHKTILPQTNGDWKIIKVELREFEKYRMGIQQGEKMNTEDLGKITRLRFIVANKIAGKFNLKIEYLHFE